MTVAYISHADCGRHDTGWGHPEHVGRLRAIPRALAQDVDLYHMLQHIEGRHATPEEIALAHDPGYVDAVRRLAAGGGGALDPDTVCSEGSWDAARAATGCLLDAVDRSVDGRARRSFCGVRPPGHHALRARAMGFCLFGNVAIAARYARSRHGVGRVLIIDWDVHHGNGTQALVERDPDVHFVSIHQWPWYPGTGAAGDRGPLGTVWNVPMPAGLVADRYCDALRRAIDAATTGFVPDLVLVSSGFDCLAGDPLGGFTLEPNDLGTLTRELVERAEDWCEGRMVVALEGGYAPARVGEGAAAVLRALR
ncbi:MAG TPA: histone deacetylase [Gemmatimonadaceae bacterium]|nr:histone deacetylase [Gemmatimonadaceae bacterium]